ncbi:MAG: glutamyl-tRNA reductase [Halanaeroarchaeum sp.]
MNKHSSVVTGARVTHDDADVCDLSSVRREHERDLLDELDGEPSVAEAFALQTCHRVEVYVVTPAVDAGKSAVEAVGFGPASARVMDHEESIRHLMRVAAGLESVVIGEDQVIGQVRDAYENAVEAGTIGAVLGEAVPKAIRVGERARTETGINEGVVSLGSAAVELAAADLDLSSATATVVGSGEMGTLATIALDRNGVGELFVANRTPERAADLVDVHDVDATVLGLEHLDSQLATTDLLVTATGAQTPVVDVGTLERAGDVYCIDLGQPRDVEPGAASLPGVTVRDLDDLDDVTERTRDQREAAAAAVRGIIDEEFERLVEQFKRQRADDVIAAMYDGADRIRRRELETAIAKLEANGGVTAEQREILESFAESLVSQMLSAPTRALRDAAEDDDWSTIATAIRLFDPEFDAEDVEKFYAESPGVDAAVRASSGESDD